MFEGLTVRYRFHKAETAGFVGAWSLDEELWSLLWITVSHAQHSIPNSQTSSALIYIALNLDKVCSNSLPPVGKKLQTTDILPLLLDCMQRVNHTGPSPLEGHAGTVGTVHSLLFFLSKGFDQPAPLENKQSDNNPPCLLGVCGVLHNFFPKELNILNWFELYLNCIWIACSKARKTSRSSRLPGLWASLWYQMHDLYWPTHIHNCAAVIHTARKLEKRPSMYIIETSRLSHLALAGGFSKTEAATPEKHPAAKVTCIARVRYCSSYHKTTTLQCLVVPCNNYSLCLTWQCHTLSTLS